MTKKSFGDYLKSKGWKEFIQDWGKNLPKVTLYAHPSDRKRTFAYADWNEEEEVENYDFRDMT